MKENIKKPGKTAIYILGFGLPAIVCECICTIVFLLSVPQNERAWIFTQGNTMLENVLLSLTLLLCGSFTAEMIRLRNNDLR